jgi:hypothetical protein
VPATRAANDPQLGAVVVVIGGQNSTAIAQGLVTQLIAGNKGSNTPETIDTDIDASSILPGSVLIDTNGNVVGVSTGIARASSPSGFVPASLLANANVTNP